MWAWWRGAERRACPRLPLPDGQAGYLRPHPDRFPRVEVQLRDLSLRGAGVEHSARLGPGETAVLEFPGNVVHLTLGVQVVRTEVIGRGRLPTGQAVLRYGSGLAFTAVGQEQERLLEGVLDRLRETTPGDREP